ncbi:MAG: hypothetical protein U9Q82_00550 [Chloroflexota bacterium]|nr:hypothetical protein [Chloroflexota bacterium]
MSAISFYLRVLQALDQIDAPYMIVGSFAGYAFGITRATLDIDIIVALKEEHFDALSEKFPLPRYYADPVMIRNSVRMGIMFNLIDTQEGVKADLVPLKREPEYFLAFERRIQRKFKDLDGRTFDAWCAQPSDIIIGKLMAWTEGRSNKHPQDIYSIIAFSLRGFSDIPIDFSAITSKAAKMGDETLKLWKGIVTDAKREIAVQKGIAQ